MISCHADFIPTVSNDSPVNSSNKKNNTGLIVGIVVPVVLVGFLAVFVVFFFIRRRKRQKKFEDEGKGENYHNILTLIQHLIFSFFHSVSIFLLRPLLKC